MKPVDQTIFPTEGPHSPIGNCFQACVASLLELELDKVPHFMLTPDDWYSPFVSWLQDRGLFCVEFKAQVPEAYVVMMDGTWAILTGRSPRGGDLLHSVIGKWNEKESSFDLVHDPYPGRKFFGSRPDGVKWIMIIGRLPTISLMEHTRDGEILHEGMEVWVYQENNQNPIEVYEVGEILYGREEGHKVELVCETGSIGYELSSNLFYDKGCLVRHLESRGILVE